MNFLYPQYMPGIVLALATFVVVIFLMERRFFVLVEKYWFYRRSFFSYLSSLLYIGGMGLLLFSLLDARGPEEKIKTPVPKARTIILIDTSASMLAEDVKPSRLHKAALIAKHFARKATGHQLAVVAFSEITKKVVPFTTDLDLIDARLDSLKNLRNQYASSALSVAIQESIQYFREIDEEARGNILVLTDGEETAPTINLKISKDIHIALVGVGTSNGGRIPLDDGRGFRFGYKKDDGSDVITKLNEKFFKKAAADIPSAQYWIANSYSLPSDEIVEFFKTEQGKGINEQDMVIRPVLMHWLVVPAILAMILSYLLKAIRVFALFALFCLPAYSADLPPAVGERLQELGQGKLNRLERIKLADDLYKAGAKQEAMALYDENLSLKEVEKNIPPEAYLNYGTALMENKEEQKGLQLYENLSQSLPPDSAKGRELQEIMEKNVVTHFKIQEQRKKEQQKKDQQKKDGQQNPQQGQSGEGEDQNQSQDKNQDQSGKGQQQKGEQGQQKDPKNQEGQGQEKDKQQGESKEKKDKKDGEGEEDKEKKDEEKKDGDKDGEQKENPTAGQMKARVKVDPKLRQLMDDDRQLQMRMIENGTRDLNKRKSRKSKDW